MSQSKSARGRKGHGPSSGGLFNSGRILEDGRPVRARALASARWLIIMHRDLLDPDSQEGNWFYNLKQADIRTP